MNRLIIFEDQDAGSDGKGCSKQAAVEREGQQVVDRHLIEGSREESEVRKEGGECLPALVVVGESGGVEHGGAESGTERTPVAVLGG